MFGLCLFTLVQFRPFSAVNTALQTYSFWGLRTLDQLFIFGTKYLHLIILRYGRKTSETVSRVEYLFASLQASQFVLVASVTCGIQIWAEIANILDIFVPDGIISCRVEIRWQLNTTVCFHQELRWFLPGPIFFRPGEEFAFAMK